MSAKNYIITAWGLRLMAVDPTLTVEAVQKRMAPQRRMNLTELRKAWHEFSVSNLVEKKEL